MRTGGWIQTYTGRKFWPLDPRPEEIHIEDIARSLSHQCRFNGHCKRFYSVAEHSVLVAYAAPKWCKLEALLHDAAEAYLTDVPRPIKPYLDNYWRLERSVESAISERFNLSSQYSHDIIKLDNDILHDERDQIMSEPPEKWDVPGEPLGLRLRCWSPDQAMTAFLTAFHLAQANR